jgi:hypothetical protein
LGEDKELIVALDCVEIDELASLEDVIEAQDLADRIAAMLTRLIDVSLVLCQDIACTLVPGHS